jgi:hypothetical protein
MYISCTGHVQDLGKISGITFFSGIYAVQVTYMQ